MHIKQIKDMLIEKAEALMSLAEQLRADTGRPLTDREQKLLREVQSDAMITRASDMIFAWQHSGDEQHLIEVSEMFRDVVNLEGHPK